MRKTLLLFFIFAFSLSAMSEDKVLQIWLANGQVVNINLNEEPVTRYADGNLVITTTKTTITYPLENVVKYTYVSGEDITSVEGISTKISQDSETITFTGLAKGTEITVYSSAGVMMRKMNSNGADKTVVSVSDLPQGVYLVKANSITYKITKR